VLPITDFAGIWRWRAGARWLFSSCSLFTTRLSDDIIS